MSIYMQVATRLPLSHEIPALRQIWEAVFGGKDAKLFFDHFFDPQMCLVVAEKNDPVAMGFIFPVGSIASCGQTVPCAMIYAIATKAEFRKKGFGSAVTNELISIGHASGYPAVVLCPSDDSLFQYYCTHTPLRDWFFACESQIEKESLPEKESILSPLHMNEISANEYRRLRKSLLADIPHIDISARVIEYQRMLCGEFGGGLFRIDETDGVSCAAIEIAADGIGHIKELLTTSGSMSGALLSISSRFPAKSYIVRTPAPIKPGSVRHLSSSASSLPRRFGMLAAKDGLLQVENKLHYMPWYGLAFD